MNKNFLKTFKLYKSYYGVIITTLILISFSQAVDLAIPYFYGQTIDAVITGKSFENLLTILLITLGLHLLIIILDSFSDLYANKRLNHSLPNHITLVGMKKVLSMPAGDIVKENSGKRISIFNKGIGSIESILFNSVYNFIPILSNSILSIIALFILSPLIGLLNFISVVLYVSVTSYANKKIEKKMEEINERNHDISKKKNEILRYAKLVKISAKENEVLEEFESEINNIKKEEIAMWDWYLKFATIREILRPIFQFGIIILVVYLIYQRQYSAGSFVAFYSWISSSFQGMFRIGRIQRQLNVDAKETENYQEMIAQKPSIDFSGLNKPEITGNIVFEDISFAYGDKDKNALENINFEIRAGETVALVGHSGAGKTTIVNLLLRVYDPTSGKILIDNYDLKDLDINHFLSHVGIVEQDIELFDETLKYNILFSSKDKNVTDAQMDIIAEQARINTFKDRLGEEGYNTIIGEKGIRLSGGEKQRVGIARVLAKKPSILILDEATSNLDSLNEEHIQHAIRNVLKGRTGIIIAHRLATIKNSDKIIVMDKGKIIGMGKHDELLKTTPMYAELVNKQSISYIN